MTKVTVSSVDCSYVDTTPSGLSAEVEANLTFQLVDGWFLFSDGLSSQQPRDSHRVVLGRYVDEKDV